MIDLEERVRRGLDAAATTQRVPPGFEDRVAHRIAAVRRHRVVRRGVMVAVVVAVSVAGVAALRPDSSTQETVASAPDRGSGWQPMADAPISSRYQALSVSMGDRVLVFGGSDKDTRLDGAVYDAAHDTWTKVPTSPFASGDAVGAWTGREAIVVSGDRDNVVAAAYDPETNSWRTLAEPPLDNAASATNHALWTGAELVVVGVAGGEGDGVSVNQVAIYDPGTDAWRKGSLPSAPLPIFGDAVWTGSEVAVVGHVNGSGKSVGNNSFQVYDPAADRWREIPWALDGVRSNVVVAWTGSRLFVGGGSNGPLWGASVSDRDAALVDLATGAWDRVPDAPLGFEGNNRFGELWTGTAVLTLDGDGARPLAFDPSTRAWHVGPASPTGPRREEVSWAWVGSRRTALIWSGGSSSNYGAGITGCCTPIDGGETYTP